jgi:hypothetical protein
VHLELDLVLHGHGFRVHCSADRGDIQVGILEEAKTEDAARL